MLEGSQGEHMADEAPVKDEEAAAIEDIAEEVTQEIAAATDAE